jgi:hypothetical protein
VAVSWVRDLRSRQWKIDKSRFAKVWRRNPSESAKMAKEKSGKIWKSLADRWAAQLVRKGFLEREIWPKRHSKVFQIFATAAKASFVEVQFH